MRRLMLPAAAAAVALFAGGCLPAISLRTGQPIGDNEVRAIMPGTTTKPELFERFGFPAAVAARGEVIVIATPGTWAAPFRAGSTYSVSSDAFFELFPGAPESDEYRRIYYFHNVVSRKMNYFMLLALYESGGTKSDRLWTLVNEKTGIVEDFAFMRSGGITVFGVPRRAVPR